LDSLFFSLKRDNNKVVFFIRDFAKVAMVDDAMETQKIKK